MNHVAGQVKMGVGDKLLLSSSWPSGKLSSLAFKKHQDLPPYRGNNLRHSMDVANM